MNIEFLNTKDGKRYIIGFVLFLIAGSMTLFSVVVNHYKHNLGVPFFIVAIAYIVYAVLCHKRYYEPNKRRNITLGVAVLTVIVWALTLKNPTQSAYLGDGMFIKNSTGDSKQIEMVMQIDSKKHQAILYLSPNCPTCQGAIPEIIGELEQGDWSKIAFVDTTQDFGRKLAKEYGVEKVPSYSDVDGVQVGRLAYKTEEGVEYYQTGVINFHVLVSGGE